MTVRELEELRTLQGEIARHRQRLQELRDRATATGHPLDGLPHGSGTRDRISGNVAALIDEQHDLEDRISQLEDYRRQLREFIRTAPTSKLRLVLALRYEDGLPWQEVADRCGGTEYATKQAAYRYIRKDQEGELK